MMLNSPSYARIVLLQIWHTPATVTRIRLRLRFHKELMPLQRVSVQGNHRITKFHVLRRIIGCEKVFTMIILSFYIAFVEIRKFSFTKPHWSDIRPLFQLERLIDCSMKRCSGSLIRVHSRDCCCYFSCCVIVASIVDFRSTITLSWVFKVINFLITSHRRQKNRAPRTSSSDTLIDAKRRRRRN